MNDSTTPLWLQVPEPSDLVKAFGSAVDVPAFFHACRFDADSAGIEHGRGVLQVARFN